MKPRFFRFKPAVAPPGKKSKHAKRAARDLFAVEPMEPRILLSVAPIDAPQTVNDVSAVPETQTASGSMAQHAPALTSSTVAPTTVDSSHIYGEPTDLPAALAAPLATTQIVFLETGGAADIDYQGPVEVNSIDIRGFTAPAGLAGQEADILAAMAGALDHAFADSAVKFTFDRPTEGEFSTVYIGAGSSWFEQWGKFGGLAEQVDAGNTDHSDIAFVFTDVLDGTGLTADLYGRQLADVVAHETGHLLGLEHAHDFGSGPLKDVAFDPKVHVAIGEDAADDAVDDGRVTINGKEYVVHPLIVAALDNWRSYYNAGTVAGDGFPDVLFGQFAIHPIDHGTWLTRVLDMAWAAQGDSTFTGAEKSQILAWSYGFLTHSAGDHFAHTLVNEFAEGVAPGFGAAAESIPTDQRDLGNMLRHFMTEAYIADALPGFDANKAERTLIDANGPGVSDDDYSDDSTPSIAFDAPIRFIYETLLRAFPNDPTPIVEMDWADGTLAATNTGLTSGTFSRTVGSFKDDGFKQDHKITVTGFSAANNGTFFVTAVSADGKVLTVTPAAGQPPMATEPASGDEKIVVRIAKTVPLAITASAATNTFTRSDVGGSFLADGFVAGMRFDALGMAANTRTYIVKSVTATVLTVEGGISSGVDSRSELVNEVLPAGVQLVGMGQRGPGLDNIFKLRDTLFEKVVTLGPRGLVNGLATLAGSVIEALVAGTSIDTYKDDLYRAYLYNWIDEIDEGVRHWAELGLAFTKAVFDAGSRRDLQQKVGDDTGFADGADPDSIRSKAEDGVGVLDVLIEELDDPNGDGSTFDSFINNHLLPMAGLPAELGLLRSGLQAFGTAVGDILQPLEDLLNPIEAAVNDVKTYVKDFLKDQFKDKFGFDFEVFDYLKSLNNKMDLASITFPGDVVIPVFKPGDHAKLDGLLGLPVAHHTGVPPIGVDKVPGITFTFYDGALDHLTDDAEMDKDLFAAYANAVTLTKMMFLMESPAGDVVAGADAMVSVGGDTPDNATGELSDLYSDILTGINGVATTYNYSQLNLNGGHGGNVMTSTLPGAPGSAAGVAWMSSIDADQVWRADNLTVNNTLFRISQSDSPTSLVNYEATGLTPGDTYKIYASWQANVTQKLDNLSNSGFPDQFISPTQFAQYTVAHDGATATFQKDQRNFSNDLNHGGLGFEQLGASASTTFTVDASGKLTVSLSNLDGTGEHHVIAGPVLFQKIVGGAISGSPFRVQNNRDPQTLAAVATPNRNYTETVAGIWTDLKYDSGSGNNPLWESATLRPVFRALFSDWINNGLDFPDLGDAATSQAATNAATKVELASHATKFGPVIADTTLEIPITATLKSAILNGLAGLVDFAATIQATPPMQVKIPGIGKSLGELIDLSSTVQTGVEQPIKDYFTNDPTPTFSELFKVISPSLGTWGALDGSAFEFELDLRAAFGATLPFSLGDGPGGYGLEIDGTLDVGATLGFVDSLTKELPRFAFGVDLADSLALADRFYIRAETLQFHAETSSDDLDFGARLGFLSVGVVDGNIDLDVNVGFDLSVLDDDADGRITLGEFTGNIGQVTVTLGGTLAGDLPIVLDALSGVVDVNVGTVTFGATDVFDTDTYFFDFDAIDIDALNFGNIDAAGIVSLIGRLSDEMNNLRDSGYFDGIDIPFVDGAVDSVLGFADVLSSGLLYDKGADGAKDGPDRLASDLNAALDDAGLASAIIVQGRSAAGVGNTAGNTNKLLFQIIDPTVKFFKIEKQSGADADFTAAGLGFVVADANDFETEHEATPADGVIGGDIKLKVTLNRGTLAAPIEEVVIVTVTAASTTNNLAVANVHQGIGDDTIKLLRADNSATFDTAQSLTLRLSTILGLGNAVAYNPATKALTINFGALLPKAEFDKEFPIGFDLDLGPLIGIQSDTTVNVHAEVGFDDDFTLGVYLGDTVPGAQSDLSAATLLSQLNGGNGVNIKTAPTITPGTSVTSAYRQLSGPATFEISLDNGVTKHQVVVPQTSLSGTIAIATLLGDINTAIAAVPALVGKIQAVNDGNRIVLKALLPSVAGFSLTAAQADPAVKDLGFGKTQTAEGPLVGDSLETFKLEGGDAKFTLTVGGVAYPVTVTKASTLAKLVPVTLENASIGDLVNDVNAALLAALPASLDNKIVAVNSGNSLVLKIADASVTEVVLTAVIDDPAVLELGLTTSATITLPKIEAVKDLALVVGRLAADTTITVTKTGGTGPSGTFTIFADDTATNTSIQSLVNDLNLALSLPTLKTGVLASFAPAGPLSFSVGLNGGTLTTVTLSAAALAGNTTLSDLVADINAALTTAGLGDVVKAKSSGTGSDLGKARVKFEGDAALTSLTITASAGNALNLPTTATATNFGGRLVADSAGNKLLLSAAEGFDHAGGPAVGAFVLAADAGFTVVLSKNGVAGSAKTVTVVNSDTTGNTRLEHLVADINKALDKAFDGALRAEIGAGSKVVLRSVAADVTGFQITSGAAALGINTGTAAATSISAFQIASSGDFTTLGLTAGPTLSNNIDFDIQVSNPGVGEPTAYRITLTGLTDIASLVTAIQTATNSAVRVEINEAKTGLVLIDDTFVEDGPNVNVFMLKSVNGSGAAADLGIIGVDAFVEAELDGRIHGGQLTGVKLTDRFFMHDATLVASLEITTPDGIDASANFGFVGIGLTGDANLTAELSVGLKDPAVAGSPGADGNISLTEFIKGLSNFSSLLAAPTLTGGGSVELSVGVTGVPFITLPAPGAPDAPKITIDVLNLGDVFGAYPDVVNLTGIAVTRTGATTFTLAGDRTADIARGAAITIGSLETFATAVSFAGGLTTVTIVADQVLPGSLTGLTIGTPILPAVDFEFENLDELLSFDNVNFSFDSIINALLLVRDLLSQIDGVGSALDTPLPLVDVSVNDLLGFADTFSDALTEAQNNPAGSLQLLDQAISEAFGVDPAGNLIAFTLDEFGTPTDRNDDLIKISLNLGAAFNKSLNVRIPDLPLGEAASLIDFGGAATLGASGSATFTLDLGIGLNNPTQFYLYDSSGLHGDISLTGTDMAFKAGLGPLSLSIINGQASIAGTVDVAFNFDKTGDSVVADAGGRTLLNGQIGAILGTLDVDFAAPIDVTLPIYFPTESKFVGNITLSGDLLNMGNGLHVQTDPAVSSGTATSSAVDKLTDTTAHFVDDGVAVGDVLRIIDGTGVGQIRAIEARTATQLTVVEDWDIAPDATSVYAVFAAATGPAVNTDALADNDKIILDVSAVAEGLANAFSNISLLDQILFVVDGVDVVLGGVQDVMDGEVLGFSMPLIGDKLAGVADVVGDFRTGFLNDFRSEVEKLADPNENGIKDILFRLLGDSGFLIAVDASGNAVKDGNGKFVSGTKDDILSYNNLAEVSTIGEAEIWWKIKIGQNLVDAGADIGLDIGIPGLALKTDGEINLDISWELNLGFGLSGADGFFLFIDDEDGDPDTHAPAELTLNVDVTLPGASLKGTLGFLEFTAVNQDVDGDDTDGNTHLSASFAINLGNESDPNDSRLGLSELGRMSFDVEIGAEASAELQMTLGIAGDAGGFPEIQAGLNLDWAIDGDPDTDGVQPISLFNPPPGFKFGSAIKDGLKLVEFRDVQLDVGAYISDVVAPLLKKIQEVTEPVQPIIDIVTTPLPVLSDLGLEITLLDIAKQTGAVNPGFITALESILDVITVVNSIDIPEDGSLLVPFGSFTIFDRDATMVATFDLTAANFDPKAFSAALKPGGALAGLTAGLPAGIGGVLDEVAGVAGELIGGLAGGGAAAGKAKGGFSFPIIEDPAQVFGMLMGTPAVLVAYDMAPLNFKAEFSAFFSIFGPLGVSINLEAALNIDFAFGYDTKGFEDFAASDFKNPLLLANGLFVSDDPSDPLYDGSDKSRDLPELSFDGGLWAAAELNLGIARGGVGGGIFIGVDFNLFDNDGDGRVRLDELVGNFLNQLKAPNDAEKFLAPLAVFDVTGQITAELFAFLKINFGLFTLNKKFNITPPIVLVDFEVDFFRPPVLASELENGDLVLNVGDFAAQRLLGDRSDSGETIFVRSAGAGKVEVWSTSLGSDATVKQTYNVGPNGKIIAVGGEGDDTIDLSGLDSTVKFEIDGGDGVDTISGGAGGGVIRGGRGNDIITGGAGADLIFGNEGADTIDAGLGNDIVLGDNGEVTEGLIDAALASRHGFVRALVTATDGADTLDGGGDDDIVVGGGAADIAIMGGAGNDIVIGDGGLVTYASPAVVSETDKDAGGFGDQLISGGIGNDWLYGGKGNDNIDGDAGNDFIFGESGMDDIDGGVGNDTIFGDFGTFVGGDLAKPVVTVGGEGDTIKGGLGADKILGGGGNDTIHGDDGSLTGAAVTDDDLILGGTGADTLHGDGGDDKIYGESDQDTLFGDAGKDVLEGGQGNDIAWGGAGDDLLVAGYGSDKLDGQDGGDTYRITARGGNVTELTTAYDSGVNPAETDLMVLIGTAQADTVLLRAMADFYFPTKVKLIGDAASEGLTDKIFASGEPDKLRAVLQALEDSYGPHDIPAGLVESIIGLYAAAVQPTADDTSGLFKALKDSYVAGSGIPALADLQKLIFDNKGNGIATDDTGILTTDSGLLPGKLEEITKAITKAYGSKPVPPTMLDALANAWDDFGPPNALKNAIENAIDLAYKTEEEVLGSSTDTGFAALINNGGDNVERFNYRDIEGLEVNTLDDDDYVVLDDVIAATTINLGLGQDRAQVGQVFNSERVKDPGTELITGITAEDVFTTLEITRGWLSNGVSEATTINGGDDGDQITVFRNVAVLNLNGGDGDDVFTVRAFALKGSSDSERARTDMKGDGGADTILYVVNAPVGIDGGDGLDTVRVVGTEFADDFVVNDAGIFGGGLNVTYVNIEKVVVDGAEGDDRFFIQSTGLEVVTEIDGGLGSDSFFVGGNPSNSPVAVVSNDFKGHSGVILHSVETGSDLAWAGVPIEGVSANVGDNEDDFLLVRESGGNSRVVEGATTGGEGSAFDSYGIRLTRQPGPGQKVTLVVVPAGLAPEDKAKGFKDLEFFNVTADPNAALGSSLGFNALTGVANTPTVVFDEFNWDQLQFVRFMAADDAASEGRRFVFINHTLKGSTDPGYQAAKMLSVKVEMVDNDRDAVIVTQSGRDNTVLENGPVVAGFTDSVDVVLSKAPNAPVTVTMSVLNGQVSLSTYQLKFDNNDDADASDGVFWKIPQTVTITAQNDLVVEGFHTDYISYTVASADSAQNLPSGGGAVGTAPAFVQIDGDFDLLGVQPVPDAKPTSYVLLPHKPVAGSVVVTVGGVQLAADRFEVSGNTLTFLSASGAVEFVTGAVQAKYLYNEIGYDGGFIKDSVIDIYDEDTPTVIIRPLDGADGSIDVVEGSPDADQYSIRLSQAPTGNVVIKVNAVDTRSTYGRTALFQEQVTVNNASQTLLTFTSGNWATAQIVTVRAIDDAVFDGNDTQVFAPDLQTVNKIRGPLIIEGAAGAGSLSLPAPLMLPGEQSILVPHGNVQTFTPGSGDGAIETMTVLKADLLAVLAELHEEDSTVSLTDLQELIGKTLELSSGAGTRLVLDPLKNPDDLFNRFWLIDALVVSGDTVTLTLQNPSIVNPALLVTPPGGLSPVPDAATKFAITSLSANFFAKEIEQIDYLFVFDGDSVANENGALTSADGVVRSFTQGAETTMTVETAALQAVAKLFDTTDLASLVTRRLEISVGPGQGRSWQIDAVTGTGDTRTLTLSDPTGGGAVPTDRSEFRIAGGDTHGRVVGFGMGPSILFNGRPQPGGISYGDIEVVQVSLGRGDDEVRVDYATNAEDHVSRLGSVGDYNTQTLLDTGAGDDVVTVKLEAGEDGAFALNLNAGDDQVDGSASTAPLVVFGWDGSDSITGGTGDDILFGDRGRVDYIKTVPTDTDGDKVPDTSIDQIITRLGHSVAANPVNPPVTSATTTTVSDSTANFPTSDGGLAGLSVQAISPAGKVQFRTIVANTATQITIDRPWDATPGAGYFYRFSALPEDQTDGMFRGQRVVRSIDEATGGDDTIIGNAGADQIIGGAAGDTVSGGEGDDIIAGDSARLDFLPITGLDGLTELHLVQSTALGVGGVDELSGNAGEDILIGGAAGDTLHGDDETGSAAASDGSDILIGDNGVIEYTGGVIDRISTSDTTEATGGSDTIRGNASGDFILGGVGGDMIHGDSATPAGHDGNDVILGDHGILEFNLIGSPYDGDPTTLDRARTTDTDLGGADRISGNAGADVILGGADGDIISGGAGDDLVFGDFADVRLGSVSVTKLGVTSDYQSYPLQATTTDDSLGGADTIYGNEDEDVLVGGAYGDNLDGGAGDDLIFGDNVTFDRTSSTIHNDFTNPRFRLLTGRIYDANGDVLSGGVAQNIPSQTGTPVWGNWDFTLLEHTSAQQVSGVTYYGDDYIAGGANDDTIFGQLGDDTIQGDGSIDIVDTLGQRVGVQAAGNAAGNPFRDANNELVLNPSFDGAGDGGDYIEGNGGNDVVFGNQGQDDLIGGSSSLFSLAEPNSRPDGSDLIFGGSGTAITRNNPGDVSATLGHANDSDMILGDNGNIYRLVGAGSPAGSYLTFTYDNYGSLKIIPRAAELLDYTPGGIDFDPANAATDLGAADELHGESGDDFIYGQKGNDIMFGEGQDDDLIGGYGNDWISGGTGDDGVLGDDGRILTSRNGTTEPLNGVTVPVLPGTIATGGNMQQADINIANQLKKAVDLTPFSTDPAWTPATDEFDGITRKNSDDIIFGGLGNDALHGGSGDDAISGAEALTESYAPTFSATGVPNGRIRIDYDHPNNPGNVLAYNPDDANGKSSNVSRAGEFYLYNEYDPLRKILLGADGRATTWSVGVAPTGGEYFLNFSANEGPAAALDITRKTDGDDKIFGDLGNDWLVGGSGRDDMYGGFGNDLLNADDDLATAGSLNNAPDTGVSYQDRAFGGAGRDVLTANTGGDRLIDWNGEYNSYLVPFSPYGAATISRSLQPALIEFLYALSASDGADATRASDVPGSDPARNGEPWGELGLVLQKDAAWGDQKGGPADPQPGNSKGSRDVLRTANFDTGMAQGFTPQVGTFAVANNRYEVAPATSGGDAVSLFNLADTVIPSFFEVQATINAVKPTAGSVANAFLIFDWQSNTNFKFAGINVSTNKLEIGRRTATGWVVDAAVNYQGKSSIDYVVMLSANGSTAKLTVGTTSVSFTFAQRIDNQGLKHGLNDGVVGIGARGGTKAQIDNVVVQAPPGTITLDKTADFSSANPASGLFHSPTPSTGSWTTSTDGRLIGTAANVDSPAINLIGHSVTPGSLLDIAMTLKTSGQGGVVFDYQGPAYYKFATLSADKKQIIIGHRIGATTTIDKTFSIAVSSGTDYKLGVTLRGGLVNVSLNGAVVVSNLYNETVTMGGYGTISMKGAASGLTSFDVVRLKTDDAGYTPAPTVVLAAPTLDSVVSRKTHGAVGTMDLPLSLGATATIESRIGGSSTLVFAFSADIATIGGSLGAGNFAIANGTYESATISGNTLTLTMSGIMNQAVTSVALLGFTGLSGISLAGTSVVNVQSLYGDVDQDGLVGDSDQLAARGHLLQTVAASNYLSDVNLSGAITIADLQLLKNAGNQVQPVAAAALSPVAAPVLAAASVTTTSQLATPAFDSGSSANSALVTEAALNTASVRLVITFPATKDSGSASVGKRKTPSGHMPGSYPTVVDLRARTASMLDGFVDVGLIYGAHSQTYKSLHSAFGRGQSVNDSGFFKTIGPARYSASNALAPDSTMEKLFGKSRHADRSLRASLSSGGE